MTLEQNSNNRVPLAHHRDAESGKSSDDFEALEVPMHTVYLRRESHVLESILVQNVDGAILYSLCRACKIPITQEGAEELINTLLHERIPSGETLSGRVQNHKSVRFKGYLELIAGKGRISHIHGFQLVDLPDDFPDILITHEKGSSTLSLSIFFDLSEIKSIRSVYGHWQRCERIVQASGAMIPKPLSLHRFGKTDDTRVDGGTEWYRAQLGHDTFISIVDISQELYSRPNTQQSVCAQSKISCYHPRMILFDCADTRTITRVIHAIDVSGCSQPMAAEKKEALIRLLGLVISSLERSGGYRKDINTLTSHYLSDHLFEFANESSPFYLDVGLKCEVHGGWKNRLTEPLDCVEVRIYGFASRWRDAFSLFVRLDPNQSIRPLFGLEWDQGSVDQKGAAVVTLEQISSFLSEFASLKRNRKCSEEEVRKILLHELKNLPDGESSMLFWPLSVGSESVTIGFYDRMFTDDEELSA